MKRTPYVVAGAILAALFMWQSCVALVREPAHPRAVWNADDYPLEKGLIWVYKAGMGLQVVRRVGENQIIVFERKTPDPYPGGEWFEMLFDLPILGTKKLWMKRNPDGVIARRDDREQLIMRFPMKPGDTWTIDFPAEDLAECTVLTPEPIKVLGKPVTASKLKIVRTNRKNGRKTTDYEWYATGIGLVRMEVTFGIKATFELERFEKAK